MKEQSGHITSKVILGYILLITIAVCSVAYIYNIVEKVADEDEAGQQDLEQGGCADDLVAQFGAAVAFNTGIGHGQGPLFQI